MRSHNNGFAQKIRIAGEDLQQLVLRDRFLSSCETLLIHVLSDLIGINQVPKSLRQLARDTLELFSRRRRTKDINILIGNTSLRKPRFRLFACCSAMFVIQDPCLHSPSL